MRSFRMQPRKMSFLLALLLVIGGLTASLIPLFGQDWREWPVYDDTAPETALLEPTGRDLQWSAPEEQGTTRLFVSNHPETLGMQQPDPATGKNVPWPTREGKLWYDEATGTGQISYQVYICHQNWLGKPVYIGLLAENLSPDVPFTANGTAVTTQVDAANDLLEGWHALTSVGLRNAYAELSNTLFRPLPQVAVPAQPGERKIIVWKLPPLATLGARVRLTLTGANDAPLHCRLSTAWAWSEETLTGNLPLIPRLAHHPRGSWPTSEVAVNNKDDVFDLAWNDQNGRTVRCLRLCQPVFENGVKVGYRADAVYTRERSFHPEQALANNGTYGARTHVSLHVKNSSNRTQTVGLYLRYPDKRLKGKYIGAATVYAYNAERKSWSPGETRAINLGTIGGPKDGYQEWWWTTRRLAAYPVPAGETLIIPLDVTHDFPAMLPLGIVLKKE